MNNKIVFKINKNILSVSLYKKELPYENLNNTNVIDTKEIIFSEDYINENIDLVSSFLNVIIIKREVTKVIIKEIDLSIITLNIINKIPNIKELVIKDDKTVTYSLFLKLLENKYLTSIDIYDIPPYLLERLDLNSKLSINVRSEILFISNFMTDNSLNTYSDIYYKKKVVINKFEDNDYLDFKSFLEINDKLKIIEFNYLDSKSFNYIMDLIIKLNKESIKIILNEGNINIDTILEIVSSYKKNKELLLNSKDITFKINYSDKYKKDNMFKQINFTFIKVTLISVILVVSLMISINFYRNLKDTEKYEDIEKNLNSIIKEAQNEPTDDYHEPEIIVPNENDRDKLTTTTTTSLYDIKYEKVFDKLLEINNDTVGWLTVNNTNIDYPVVKASDNDYYLNRDYYKNKNRHGWIFIDYRNSIEELSKNTIIYGHNLANQKMFGTLRYALNSGWYKKTSNQVITFNTLNETIRWQIFSIYKIPVTTDYLYTDFSSNEEFLEFVSKIKSRSIFDFNVDIQEDDNILTLSTCSNGHDQRLVIHAKKIKEN